jgi:translation initiation factor 3 subunit K
LASADYSAFWSTLDSDDLYADLVADVSGFEELMRVRIAVAVSQSWRQIQRTVLEEWLNLRGKEFEHFVVDVCAWDIEGDVVKVPTNKENEAKGTVIRENVKFDRKSNTSLLDDLATDHCCRVFPGHSEGLRAASLKCLGLGNL